MKKRFQPPKIITKKVKTSFFLSEMRSFDSMDNMLKDNLSDFGQNCFISQGSPCNSGKYI